MDAGGNPREGWMAVIPMGVLILITTYIVGGPVEFVNLVHRWGTDFFSYVANVIKHL
jgi:hypothetical protein